MASHGFVAEVPDIVHSPFVQHPQQETHGRASSDEALGLCPQYVFLPCSFRNRKALGDLETSQVPLENDDVHFCCTMLNNI